MRTIKFRAWENYLKIMLPPIDLSQNPKYWEWNFDSDDKILMQYTGLKDKNGKEIYEGDIVVGHNNIKYGGDGTHPTGRMRVYFGNGMFCMANTSLHKTMLDSCTPNTCEIIGNIYESPEQILSKSFSMIASCCSRSS